MAYMEIAVWFGREARVDTAIILADFKVFIDDISDKICCRGCFVGCHVQGTSAELNESGCEMMMALI